MKTALIVILLVVLTGCGGTYGSPEALSASSTQSQTTTPKQPIYLYMTVGLDTVVCKKGYIRYNPDDGEAYLQGPNDTFEYYYSKDLVLTYEKIPHLEALCAGE